MKRPSGIISWFAHNPVAANLLMIFILLAGLLASTVLRKQVYPTETIKTITVSVDYPGASPLEVEEGISIKVEQAIEDIDGIKKVTSTAAEQQGTTTIEVADGFDTEIVLAQVRMRVNAISTFPALAEQPLIYRNKPDRQVIWMQVYGDLDEHAMKQEAHRLRNEVLRIPGISDANVVGDRADEVSIDVSEYALRKYQLTFADVVDAVRHSSLNLPGGTIHSEGGDIQLRVQEQAYSAAQFAQIPLRTTVDGSRLMLGDVATISDGFVEQTAYSHFDGQPSIGIQISAVGDQNELTMARRVKAFVAEQQAQLIPGAHLSYWADSSFYLQDRLSLMLDNLLLGALLVMVVLALLLRIQLAFWVMMGLPVCFLGTMAMMSLPGIDISINMLSLFGFILALGIVVDDAIVIAESAYSEVERHGAGVNAVIRGAHRVAMPTTFGVLTTIVAFVPMIWIGGPEQMLWRAIGMVAILCLLFSIVESKFILPAHLRHLDPVRPLPARLQVIERIQQRGARFLAFITEQLYVPVLQRALRWRYTILAIGIALLGLTYALLAGGHVRWVASPSIPSDYIQASVTMKPGSTTAERDQALATIEQTMVHLQQRLQQQYGETVVRHISALSDDALSGEIWVELSKGQQRQLDARDIAKQWRQLTPAIPGARQLQFNGSTAAGGGADIAFQLSGVDLTTLRAAADDLKQQLRHYQGVYDVRDSFSQGVREVRLQLKPAGEALGLTREMLAEQVRDGFYGAEAQRIQRPNEEVKVMVRYPRAQRQSLGDLEQMRIRLADGTAVPFSAVATYRLAAGYATIQRINGVRAITVSATVDKTQQSPSAIEQHMNEQGIPQLVQRYPNVHYGLTGAALDNRQALSSLESGAVLAFIVIYALMAVPLRSYGQPLLIMVVIPFGFIGAVLGHIVLGLPLSMMSLCGMVALAGMVVNDSLVLVDAVNHYLPQAASLSEAVLKAARGRFRAIVLTSLTTFLGLAPMCLEQSLQALKMIPMAASLAFGVLFATVITLLLLPCLLLILADIKTLVSRLYHQRVLNVER